MAQLWSTGPALIYVAQTGAGSGPAGRPGGPPSNIGFLGTAEFSPEIHIRRAWDQVFNDLGGDKVPFDVMYESKEAFTFADLTLWNQNLYDQCAAAPRTVTLNPSDPAAGSDFAGDIGSLMIKEGLTYSVFIRFPYSAKPAYNSGTAGYRFPFSYLMGPDQHAPIGTKPRKLHVVFHHLRGYDSAAQTFLVYDQAYMDLLPPPDIQ